jgi:hypothetical protein
VLVPARFGGAHSCGCRRGKAVQVDPIKPTLKPPRINLLTLKYDILVSNVAFKFNLRRYTVVAAKSDIEEFKTDLDAARLERQHKEEYEELRRQCMKAGSGDGKQSG